MRRRPGRTGRDDQRTGRPRDRSTGHQSPLAAQFLDRWALRLDGPAWHGKASLVLPVTRADGAPAALKLQRVDEESIGEPIGLHAWHGDGVVLLLDHDPDTGTMLLERLDAARPLSAVPDDTAATRTLAELLARLVVVPAPAGPRRLADIAAAMLSAMPRAVPTLHDPAERRLLQTCESALSELIGEPGDRRCTGTCTTTTSSPGGGNPGWPSTPSRWAETPDSNCCPRCTTAGTRWWPPATCRGRCWFDLLTEALNLDRQRATGWTLGRVLQNALWDIQDGETALDPAQVAIATALLDR